MTFEQLLQLIIASIIAMVFGWVAASFSKASKKDVEETWEEIEKRDKQITSRFDEFASLANSASA